MTNDWETRLDNQDRMERLEKLVDETSIRTVLEMLGDICGAKAEHLRTAWQDEGAAEIWEADARRLGKVAGQSWGV